jgi:hypothetical protein
MEISGITWKGQSVEDIDILPELPAALARLLSDVNGFILYEGALHVRGASLTPEWHSLREAWRGPNAFSLLYPDVSPSDIPFAQDQVGDQLLLRGDSVLRLFAETGQIEHLADTLSDFFTKVNTDIERFLNVALGFRMDPGQLFHAFPPFCFQQSENASLKPLPAIEVIRFHADLAKQIRDIPDGAKVEIKVTD